MAQYINRNAPGSGLATLMAARGRGGDTELVHMTRPEVKKLEASGLMSLNPQTGLPEYFLGGLKNFAKSLVKPRNLAAMAASIALGPMVYGAAGSALQPMLGSGFMHSLGTGVLGGAALGAPTGWIAGHDPWESAAAGGFSGGLGATTGYLGQKVRGQHSKPPSWVEKRIADAQDQRRMMDDIDPTVMQTLMDVDHTSGPPQQWLDLSPPEQLEVIQGLPQEKVEGISTGYPKDWETIGLPDKDAWRNINPRVREAAVRTLSPSDLRGSMAKGRPSFAGVSEAAYNDAGVLPTEKAFIDAKYGKDVMWNPLEYYKALPHKAASFPAQTMGTIGLLEQHAAQEEQYRKELEAMQAGAGGSDPYVYTPPDYYSPEIVEEEDIPSYEEQIDYYFTPEIPSPNFSGRWFRPGALRGENIWRRREAKEGGLVSLEKGGRAFEGKVEGPGHGMQDNVVMPIEGGGIAAVSPKEYVVPADVMAMLGNGNADDGSEKMDRFISKFRKTKYGRDTQPPEMDGSTALQSLVRS